MSLTIGTQLGSYEITGSLGAGGMGEVYRARDTKLGRDVAIKTLPASLADDKDRLARFEREARLLASLNHGHIASVYGLDAQDGTLYIAMELVEGESLDRITSYNVCYTKLLRRVSPDLGIRRARATIRARRCP